MIAELWKALFWQERRMSQEFGPPLGVVYADALKGLTDEQVMRYGQVLIDGAKEQDLVTAMRATARLAGAPR